MLPLGTFALQRAKCHRVIAQSDSFQLDLAALYSLPTFSLHLSGKSCLNFHCLLEWISTTSAFRELQEVKKKDPPAKVESMHRLYRDAQSRDVRRLQKLSQCYAAFFL